jgi:hypothetical protein
MALAAISRNPIFVFTTKNTWVEVPIPAVSFEEARLVVDEAFSDAGDPNVTSWLAYLASVGSLWAGAALPPTKPPPADPPPALPALVLFSATRGSTGNGVRIDIEYSATEENEYTVTATKTDTYEGMTLDGVERALDERPGLVRVKSHAHGSKLPAERAATPVESDGTLTIRDDDDDPVFVLSTAGSSADDKLVTVAVTRDEPTGTFSLTAQWSKAVTVDGAADAAAQLAALNGTDTETGLRHVATFAAPAGTALALPQPGSFLLSGGQDSTRAETTIFAK